MKWSIYKMPIRKASNGKYAIGSGKGIYKSYAAAKRAYAAYLAKKTKAWQQQVKNSKI
jgi:hypothetical protein